MDNSLQVGLGGILHPRIYMHFVECTRIDELENTFVGTPESTVTGTIDGIVYWLWVTTSTNERVPTPEAVPTKLAYFLACNGNDAQVLLCSKVRRSSGVVFGHASVLHIARCKSFATRTRGSSCTLLS